MTPELIQPFWDKFLVETLKRGRGTCGQMALVFLDKCLPKELKKIEGSENIYEASMAALHAIGLKRIPSVEHHHSPSAEWITFCFKGIIDKVCDVGFDGVDVAAIRFKEVSPDRCKHRRSAKDYAEGARSVRDCHRNTLAMNAEMDFRGKVNLQMGGKAKAVRRPR